MNEDENGHPAFKQIESYPPADIADLIQQRPLDEQMEIFEQLKGVTAVHTFEFLPLKIQQEILEHLPSNQMAWLLNSLSPDDRTAFLEELPVNTIGQLLKYLSPKERAISIRLLGYPENSIGRLMTPDYISIKMDWSVQQVLDYIRAKGKDSETLNVIYAVDDRGKLVDDFHIRQILLANPKALMSDLGDKAFVALNVDDDQETAIELFRKYDRVALPVVDPQDILLGIVTIDDIIDIALEEDTEDMLKMGGMSAFTEPYLEIPFFELMKKRVGWLIILFLGEMMTASALGYFQDEISQAVVLALFLPLIVSSGGNAGSQASTLIIRAMAVGDIKLRDWYRIMRREIFSGLFLGIVLGLIGFFRISIWSAFSSIYGPHWTLVGITVFFALIGVVLWGTLTGSMLPLILRRLGADPAVSSAPFVATLVDVAGIIIYFSIALIILRGTLL